MLVLPPEIALAVAEAAALRYTHTSKCWVASLCLVCKAFDFTVRPILYDFVVIGASNWTKVSWTADSTALFSRTRTLVVLPSFIRGLPDNPPSGVDVQTLQFPNVEEYTGWLPGVIDGDNWRLKSLSLAYGRTCKQRRDPPPACVATSLTHLHLSSDTQGCYFDLSQCAVLTHIVWDFCSQTTYMREIYDIMLPGMCTAMLEQPPAMQRLLLRTFHLPVDVAPQVSKHIHVFATEQQIDRLWLDDSRVLLGGGDARHFVDEDDQSRDPGTQDYLAVRDALRGRDSGSDWYLAGRQLYTR
ncbi:hypothetical protein AURDEDRAFT_182456 [Auricularia subglabra TFB-10046 SS5]|nr:hypothetical protein AURDEDRAFT_182456 [Auricularia subglabra TFB-10046 SS5]